MIVANMLIGCVRIVFILDYSLVAKMGNHREHSNIGFTSSSWRTYQEVLTTMKCCFKYRTLHWIQGISPFECLPLLTIHHFCEYDALVQLSARDMATLSQTVLTSIGGAPNVVDERTSVVFQHRTKRVLATLEE